MSKKISLSPEDQAQFQHAMRDVTPLKQCKPKIKSSAETRSVTTHPAKPINKTSRQAIHHDSNHSWDLSDYYSNSVHGDSILSYHLPGLCKAQMQTLRTGAFIYDAKLDLHGLNATEAKTRLVRFLQTHIQAQHRWLLIIHGKGGRFGESPILKNLVNHWLRQIPNILAFRSAQSKHGGTGAVYVLLKRDI